MKGKERERERGREREKARERASICENAIDGSTSKIRIHFWNVFNRGPPAFVHRYVIRVFVYNYIALSCCMQKKQRYLLYRAALLVRNVNVWTILYLCKRKEKRTMHTREMAKGNCACTYTWSENFIERDTEAC